MQSTPGLLRQFLPSSLSAGRSHATVPEKQEETIAAGVGQGIVWSEKETMMVFEIGMKKT